MPVNPIQKMLQEAAAQDERRQAQITEQLKVINRLKDRMDRAEEFITARGLSEDYERFLRAQESEEGGGDGVAPVPAGG